MKKQYITPELMEINISMTSIVCTSLNISSTSQDNDKALGRGVFWEDEDEE